MRSSQVEWKEPFNRSHHGPNSRGRIGLCTECGRRATFSVKWRHPTYPQGWKGSYCDLHEPQ